VGSRSRGRTGRRRGGRRDMAMQRRDSSSSRGMGRTVRRKVEIGME
jgi:hypothetical protein